MSGGSRRSSKAGSSTSEASGSQVERTADAVDVLGPHLEPRDEQREQRLAHAGLDLQAHDAAAAAVLELLLDRRQQVEPALVVEVQLGVAGDAEARDVDDRLAGEERAQLGADHVFEQQVGEAVDAGRADETRQAPGHLDDGEAPLALVVRGGEQDGEVQAQAREHREGPRGVDRERRQRGQDLVPEVAGERRAGHRLELLGPQQPQAALGEPGRICSPSAA